MSREQVDKASSHVSAKGWRGNEITRISGRVSSSSEIPRRWISRRVTRGGTAILSQPPLRLLPGSGISSRCTMISGRWALNRGIAVECQMRGGIRFPSNRQQEIYTIDHAQLFLLLLLLPSTLIPATPSFDYRPRVWIAQTIVVPSVLKKQRLLTGLRKRVVKSADLRLSCYNSASDATRLLKNYAKLRICKFLSTKYGHDPLPAKIYYFRSFLLVTKRYSSATSMRIMSVR